MPMNYHVPGRACVASMVYCKKGMHPDHYLAPTPGLDRDAPIIQARVAQLIEGAASDAERAVRIHSYVRDQILFGWSPEFDRQTASETLAAGIGFCNTKTPLFVTMLRAAGIPARMHFVGIDKEVLAGVINPMDRYVDHSYAEVFLNNRWLAVDSYIVDAALHRQAIARLQKVGKVIGFGVHRNGTPTWNGETDSFSQFVNDGTCPRFSDRDFGLHSDTEAFYASGQARTPRNFLFRKVLLPALLFFGNRRVRALRKATP